MAPPEPSLFKGWTQSLSSLEMRVVDGAIEMAPGEDGGLHILHEPDLPTPSAGTGKDYTATVQVPVLLSHKDLAPFINPLFWGNFCAIQTSNGQIYGCNGVAGWKGDLQESFSLKFLGKSLQIQNLLDIDYSYPLSNPYASAGFSLKKAIEGGITIDQGYMQVSPWSLLGFEGSWLAGNKTVNFDSNSPIGKILHKLPHFLVEEMLKAFLHWNLLLYSFHVMERFHSPGDLDRLQAKGVLDTYFQELDRLGFDREKGLLKQAGPQPA